MCLYSFYRCFLLGEMPSELRYNRGSGKIGDSWVYIVHCIKFSADDIHFIKVALFFCCFQGCFDVKVRQFLCVDIRVSIGVRGCAGGGKEFCWLITSRSALRHWCEINNLLRAASTRGGGFLHAYGFQSDLRQHVRLGSNGVEFMVFCVYEFFVLCWPKHEVRSFCVDGTRMCKNYLFENNNPAS